MAAGSLEPAARFAFSLLGKLQKYFLPVCSLLAAFGIRFSVSHLVLFENCHSMKFFVRVLTLGWIFASTALCSATCLAIGDAVNHIGETRCVTGKVFKVEEGNAGVHYLDFCEKHETCPFTVVIFPSDLRYVGDVRQLAGKIVEIHGPVKMYDSRAEIILSDRRQLKGEAAQIPPLPKTYDVEKKGRYSAGKFSLPKPAKRTPTKRQTAPIPANDPSDSAASLD